MCPLTLPPPPHPLKGSESGQDQRKTKQGFFPPEKFEAMQRKVLATIYIQYEQSPGSKRQSKFLPSKSSPEAAIPLHFFFEDMIRKEWDKPDKHVSKNDLRFYRLQETRIPLLWSQRLLLLFHP